MPRRSNANSSTKKCDQTAVAKAVDPCAVNQVLKWIIQGATEQDIHEAIAKHYPGEQPRPLILNVMEQLQAAANYNRDVLIGWCFEATRDLYRRMVEIGDFAGALRAIKQLTELTRFTGDTNDPPADENTTPTD